ncbi:PRC-barrel domain-containing protein [Roseovarius amoyensis]|uniref:PRC-barrel domain-containing protein n=1 Tax=Roseovarius amoyensis TaxID=2211448 RepID=UPI000DBE936D|nr:PRC-barrel domain-containing protein [Roseovarius amoyensis]
MKRILTTTALAVVLATPLAAQTDGDNAWKDTFRQTAGENDIHASNFIGSRVYVSEAEVNDDMLDEASDEWDDVGEINDVLMDRNGDVTAILVDIGGFLGIGEKTVAVQMDRLQLVSDGDAPDEYFVVFNSSQEALENVPAFEDDRDSAMMTGTDSNMTDEEREMADRDDAHIGYPAAPEVKLEGYDTVVVTDLKVEELTGAPVYDARNEWIGEVSDLIIDTDGQATDAIIDVGGFLGIGEKPVQVSFESLTLKRADGTDDIRIYIDATEDQLESMPDYEG